MDLLIDMCPALIWEHPANICLAQKQFLTPISVRQGFIHPESIKYQE